MGVISMSTPLTDSLLLESTFDAPVQRQKREKIASPSRNDCIPVMVYRTPEKSALASCILKPVTQLYFPYTLPALLNCDVIWHMGYFFNSDKYPRPNWSGFMQSMTTGSHLPPAEITMLLIIDLNLND
jgi:hypothetical protein